MRKYICVVFITLLLDLRNFVVQANLFASLANTFGFDTKKKEKNLENVNINKYVVLNALDVDVYPHVLFVANRVGRSIPGRTFFLDTDTDTRL